MLFTPPQKELNAEPISHASNQNTGVDQSASDANSPIAECPRRNILCPHGIKAQSTGGGGVSSVRVHESPPPSPALRAHLVTKGQ